MEIVTINRNNREKILRKKAEEFVFADLTKKEIRELIVRMRRIMKDADGIGLAANQVGLPYRMFVAEIPDEQGRTKFYALFNPKLEKVSEKKRLLEEGCLSVPGVFGTVERAERVTLSAEDKDGRPVKIRAWGLLAHVFQHELDHLEGGLFIDKASSLYKKEADDDGKN
ncbi:MAG: peptide deformylase [Candidatus Liptonbacteria bacterium GWC1_60_9]|uniref:Peptide deformylase n=3 Tax=Candidatus Liptoniibacteriota TaxID=1817909 RepID=A0A1G2CM20_9BACT|nr:MAG: peptide deformylase [Candidatus Liptonbacteria bacterium GWC1_60_9]OGY98712.1 MAG: peptide deformylase [Candidatus Liptonbacteria bacterium RIFCSPHIGHO2_12_FULL_60_13]OGZ02252.1 MAG: peptide deformylase [Candidatus Liptonbacteria bacterium RIFCSPLOWO2_12_FULL_60_15]